MTKVTNSLQQKLGMRLSPDQIMVARLIEIPSIELSQRINEELQENPTLVEISDIKRDNEYNDQSSEGVEEGEGYYDEPVGSSSTSEDLKMQGSDNEDSDDYDYTYSPSGSSASQDFADFGMVASVSIIEHLKSQIYLTKMDKPQRHIAKWVIGNIDDDGFLRRSVEQLCNDLYFQEGLEVSRTEMEAIIDQIRNFDPPGIASSSLQECLLFQLRHKKSTPSVILSINILTKYFEAFSAHKYGYICEQLDIGHEELRSAINEITHLNPKPINSFMENSFEKHRSVIIPDFYIENREGSLFLFLNTSSIPTLKINHDYEQMLTQYENTQGSKKNKSAIKFLKGKINDAKWFIKAIQMRNETLFNTMSAIMSFQRDFFIEGETAYLKPMILQDIADKTGYDISTISRVSNSKYVQTDFGIFPLRYFFSDSFQKENGEVISSRHLKETLIEIIRQEDKNAPFNDDQLVEKMNERGYSIARRTVTKYRKLLNIPVARLRKDL